MKRRLEEHGSKERTRSHIRRVALSFLKGRNPWVNSNNKSTPATTLAARPLTARTLPTALAAAAASASATLPTTSRGPIPCSGAGSGVGVADALSCVDDAPDGGRVGRCAELLASVVAVAALGDEVLRAVVGVRVRVCRWQRRRGWSLVGFVRSLFTRGDTKGGLSVAKCVLETALSGGKRGKRGNWLT
jgi:hypothetical protein